MWFIFFQCVVTRNVVGMSLEIPESTARGRQVVHYKRGLQECVACLENRSHVHVSFVRQNHVLSKYRGKVQPMAKEIEMQHVTGRRGISFRVLQVFSPHGYLNKNGSVHVTKTYFGSFCKILASIGCAMYP